MMKTQICYAHLNSPIGDLGLVATPKGVFGLSLHKRRFSDLLEKAASLYGTKPAQNQEVLREEIEALNLFFAGKSRTFEAKIDLSGVTPFQRRVLNVLREISYGKVRSYQWVAQQIGAPQACRAVGAACAANPVPILVPCHRVISKNGSLGGFSAGTGIKKWLLSLEERSH